MRSRNVDQMRETSYGDSLQLFEAEAENGNQRLPSESTVNTIIQCDDCLFLYPRNIAASILSSVVGLKYITQQMKGGTGVTTD